jgi:hypothetical protein
VIVWPLRSADRSRPPRCFMRKVSPTALNPLKAAAVSAGSTAILYFTYSEPLAFNLIQRPIHLWKTDTVGDAEAVSRISSALLIATVRPAL